MTAGQNDSVFRTDQSEHVYPGMTHLDGAVLEDRRLPEAVLPPQGRLQQDDQPAPLHSPWVLHGVQRAGQAGSRAQTPDGGERLRLG